MITTIKSQFSEVAATTGKLHNRHPVWVVSGCCEPAWSCPKQFEQLGLEYAKDYYDYNYERWGKHSPLTEREWPFVAEDCVGTELGDFLLNGVTLYQGKKWLFPNVEICFDGPKRRFSVGSYGNQLAKDVDEGLQLAHEIAAKVDHEVPATMDVIVYPEMEDDRHLVGFLMPFSFAYRLGGYHAYKGWILDRFGPPKE